MNVGRGLIILQYFKEPSVYMYRVSWKWVHILILTPLISAAPKGGGTTSTYNACADSSFVNYYGTHSITLLGLALARLGLTRYHPLSRIAPHIAQGHLNPRLAKVESHGQSLGLRHAPMLLLGGRPHCRYMGGAGGQWWARFGRRRRPVVPAIQIELKTLPALQGPGPKRNNFSVSVTVQGNI